MNLLSSESHTAKSGASGEFMLPQLLPGSYRLTVSGGVRGQVLMGSSMLTLGSGDLKGVVLTANAGAVVSGRIVFEGNFEGSKTPPSAPGVDLYAVGGGVWMAACGGRDCGRWDISD